MVQVKDKANLYKNGYPEYLLVANPDAEVREKIAFERLLFTEHNWGKQPAVEDDSIRVAQFFASESMEDTIIRWVQRICSQQHSFMVELNNYSGLPPGLIYLRIQDPQPFRQLASQLKVIDSYVRSNNCPPAQLVDRPYLPLVRELEGDHYSRALTHFSRRDFHSSFLVKELVLLKRKTEFASPSKVMVFRFLPQLENLVFADSPAYATASFSY